MDVTGPAEIVGRVFKRLEEDPKDNITDVFPDEKAFLLDALENERYLASRYQILRGALVEIESRAGSSHMREIAKLALDKTK